MLTSKSVPCQSCKGGQVPTPIGYSVLRCILCGEELKRPTVSLWLKALEHSIVPQEEGNDAN